MHAFIFTPGVWLGEGKIRLSSIDEELHFYTRWDVERRDSLGEIFCLQKTQIKGLSDTMDNQYIVMAITPSSFEIELDNPQMGKAKGEGILEAGKIAWEFKVPEMSFSGFEVYERQEDETYLMRAEYANDEQFRTLIEGKIWRKQTV